ncbi:MAG TPA: WYL domain-containing protein, partial [Acidimicrobiales bacterium]|nr:WYL domain-containing protein [Acidimicrobiales bacterium]
LGGETSTEAIWKLGGVAAPDGTGATGNVADLPGGEHLAVLFGGIATRSTVRFDYKGEPRVVDPYHLAFRKGWWYLSAHDHDRAEERMFRLDRITSAPEAGAPDGFVRPDGVDFRPAQPWEMGDEEPVIARLKVDADQALLVMPELGEDRVDVRHPDGAITFAVPVVSRDNFRSFVLGLLDHAEILEPAELREEMVAWLGAMAGR